MRFFLLRRRQCLKVDMAEKEKKKYREKLPKIEGLVCGHTLSKVKSTTYEVNLKFII